LQCVVSNGIMADSCLLSKCFHPPPSPPTSSRSPGEWKLQGLCPLSVDIFPLVGLVNPKIQVDIKRSTDLCDQDSLHFFSASFIQPTDFCVWVWYWGFELRASTLSHSTSPVFCDRVFQDRVSRTICLGWLRTVILLISAF
jgi:hypothetical protein